MFPLPCMQAQIADGSPDDVLRQTTSRLATVVADYKMAAKHARKLSKNSKAKAKAAPAVKQE